MPCIITAQRTEEWLAAREGKLTASLAAAALGLCPFRSAKAAWREITQRKTEAEIAGEINNRHLQFGVAFEAKARLEYEAISGNWVTETGFWVSEQYPWLGASPDGLVGEDGLVEIKAPEFCAEMLKPHYRIQMLVQLIVTDRQWCDYFSYGWRGTGNFLMRVEALSPPGEQALMRHLKAWYDRYVLTGEEPPRKKARKRQTWE
jgi:putative phage-type endonuclease